MKRVLCLIRESLVYRRIAFLSGLREAGYRVVDQMGDPEPGDLLVIWNRYGQNDATATRFERAGAQVVIAENGYLGKSWLGFRWLALSLGQHAGAGSWNVGPASRWDDLNVKLAPWRPAFDGETLVLGQRGIGSPLVRSPDGWAQSAQKRFGGRIRAHPGKKPPAVSLEDDLARVSNVVTWNSSAAFTALMLGIPVWHEFPHWIGKRACRSTAQWGKVEPNRSDEDRLAMFRSLIWAMWRVEEIEDGTAFRKLLGTV